MTRKARLIIFIAAASIVALGIVLFFSTNSGSDDIFSSREFLAIAGEWQIIAYDGAGIQSHISPVPDGYYVTSAEELEHNNRYLNTKIIINRDTITDYYPPAEFDYYYDSTEDLFFGYKVPVGPEAPILYVRLNHKDYGNFNFLLGSDGHAYMDIDAFFYTVIRTHETSQTS